MWGTVSLPRSLRIASPQHHRTTSAEGSGNPKKMKSICAECGQPYEMDGAAGKCDDCRPRRDYSTERKIFPSRREAGNRHARGYDNEWQRLSLRARRRQPWCSDCGSPHDLTADHSVAAWQRKEAGKSIRLQDIDVVCRSCNAVRGAARGPEATDDHRGPHAIEILEVTVTPGEDGQTFPAEIGRAHV